MQHRVIPPHEQDFAFPFVELHEICLPISSALFHIFFLFVSKRPSFSLVIFLLLNYLWSLTVPWILLRSCCNPKHVIMVKLSYPVGIHRRKMKGFDCIASRGIMYAVMLLTGPKSVPYRHDH